jgi:hypothetical protein
MVNFNSSGGFLPAQKVFRPSAGVKSRVNELGSGIGFAEHQVWIGLKMVPTDCVLK